MMRFKFSLAAFLLTLGFAHSPLLFAEDTGELTGLPATDANYPSHEGQAQKSNDQARVTPGKDNQVVCEDCDHTKMPGGNVKTATNPGRVTGTDADNKDAVE